MRLVSPGSLAFVPLASVNYRSCQIKSRFFVAPLFSLILRVTSKQHWIVVVQSFSVDRLVFVSESYDGMLPKDTYTVVNV